MSFRRTPSAHVLGFLFALSAAAAPQTRSISGVVETLDGKRLPHVTVRVTNMGGTATTDSGEFTIRLKSGIEPGDPVQLSVSDWVITSPWEGRTFVPKRDTDKVHVRVVRKGDPAVLSNAQVVQQIVQGVTSQLGPRLTQPANPDDFLAGKA